MKEKIKCDLMFFVTHYGMYISPVSKETISAFVSGYVAYQGNDDTIGSISTHLKKKGFEKKADGWLGQMTLYATEMNLSWPAAFQRLVIDLLLGDASSDEIKGILRKRVCAKIAQLQSEKLHLDVWLEDWCGLVPIESGVFQKLWSEDLLEILQTIDHTKLEGLSADQGLRLSEKFFSLLNR